MNRTEQRVIAITDCKVDAGQRHLSFVENDRALCGYEIGFDHINVLPDYKDVASNGICDDCLEEYKRWTSSGGKRSPTVRCNCDVITREGLETCNTVVSAYKARELSHPDSDSNLPVCPNCYRWLQSLSSNGVEKEYEEAQPWIEQKKSIAE